MNGKTTRFNTLVLGSLAVMLAGGPATLMAEPTVPVVSAGAGQSSQYHGGQLASRVRAATKDSGLELLSFSVQEQRTFGNGAPSSGETGAEPLSEKTTSCTATAEVGIPGGTKIEVSATAPTCAQAVAMVIAGIKAIKAAV